MKILAYSHRSDETKFYKEFSEKYNVEVVLCNKRTKYGDCRTCKGI